MLRPVHSHIEMSTLYKNIATLEFRIPTTFDAKRGNQEDVGKTIGIIDVLSGLSSAAPAPIFAP
jgi:hypothetical protein